MCERYTRAKPANLLEGPPTGGAPSPTAPDARRAERPAPPQPVAWWRRSRTVFLAAFLLVVLTVGVAQVAAVRRAHERALEVALANLREAAETLASATQFLVTQYARISETAAQAVFDLDVPPPQRRRLLVGLRAKRPGLGGVVAISPEGRIVDSDPPSGVGIDVSDRAYFRKIVAGASAAVSELLLDPVTGAFGVAVAGAGRDPDGRLIGLITLTVRATEFARELGLRLSDDVFTVVIDETGRIIAHGKLPELSWEERDVSGDPRVRAALAGRAVVLDREPGIHLRGGFIGALVQAPELGWVVGALQPASSALAAADRERRLALATAGVVLGLGVLLALLLGTWLSRPIAALASGVAAIGRGELAHRVPVRSRDELGWLAAHVNAMAARLEAAMRETKDLNEELAAANEELQANAARLEDNLAELEAANQSLDEAVARADQARSRLAFLAEASAALGAALDYEATLAAVARLAVPAVADWCFVDLASERGATRRVALAHVPSEAAFAETVRRRSFSLDAELPVPRAIRTGHPELLAEVDAAWLAEPADDPAQRTVVEAIGPRSCIVAPLVARGRTLGAITLVSTVSGRRYGAEDLALAEELARRAAVAVDNARLYDEVQRALRARDAFLARASHELRTPLTSALGTMRMVERTGLAVPGPLAGLVRVVSRNLRAMAELINDLLDASRLAHDPEPIDVRPLDAAAVVGAACELVAGQARDRGVKVRCKVAEGLRLTADPLRVEQLFVNLLGNAIKFTAAEGEVVVTAAREADEVVFRVRDTGEGIAPEDLERIFEPFVQAGGRAGRRERGTGLGLTICRQIVALHGGRIHAESDGPGRGATFVVRLPLAGPTAPHQA